MSYNIENFLKSWANGVVRQQRGILASKNKNVTKKLSKSLKYDLIETDTGYRLEFFMEYYGKFVDKGVRGTKVTRTYIDINGKRKRSPYKFKAGVGNAPNIGALRNWINKRRIKGRDSLGRFIKSKSLAYLFSKSIQSKGIKATSFFSKPLSLALRNFRSGLEDAIYKQIENDLKSD